MNTTKTGLWINIHINSDSIYYPRAQAYYIMCDHDRIIFELKIYLYKIIIDTKSTVLINEK